MLVDTTVWVDHLRRGDEVLVRNLAHELKERIDVAVRPALRRPQIAACHHEEDARPESQDGSLEGHLEGFGGVAGRGCLRRDRRADPGRSPAGRPGGEHRADRALLAHRRLPPPQDRVRRLGQGHGRSTGRLHRAARAGPAWLFAAKSLAHAAVLRGLPGRSKTLTTVERIAVVLPSASSSSRSKRPEEREFYLRMAIAGTLAGQARGGAAASDAGRVRAGGAQPAKTLNGVESFASRRRRQPSSRTPTSWSSWPCPASTPRRTCTNHCDGI